MKNIVLALFMGTVLCVSGCGRDDGSADRNPDVNKVLQDAAQKEKKMYESIQTGMEKLEKSVPEQKGSGDSSSK